MQLKPEITNQKLSGHCGPLEVGISFLEFAFCSVLFCSLVMLSTALWNTIDVSNGLMRVVDRYAHEIRSTAYHYQRSSGRYTIDFAAIRKELKEKILERAFTDLLLEARISNKSQVRLEFALTTVKIDKNDGSIISIEEINDANVFGKGALEIPTFLSDGEAANGEIDFNTAVKSFINTYGTSIAVPRHNYGISAEDRSFYFEQVALISVRAIYKIAESALAPSIGDARSAYIWDIKVTNLRERL